MRQFIVIFILLIGCLSTTSQKEVKEQLAEEFLRAYSHKNISSRMVEVSFSAKEEEVEIFEGNTQKAWAYNSSIPGPVIRIKLGDTIKIKFKNELPQPTTIHFHGIRVPNAMDGVPGVTQLPIKPGEIFVYEFTPKDPGTYWFHPHIRGHEQLEKGLYGGIIVEDGLTFDKDVVVFLDDWLVNKDGSINENFESLHAAMMNGRWGNVITANGKTSEIINIKSGERLRLRIINAANARIFNLTHNSTQKQEYFAIDGFFTRKPKKFSWYDLAPGNRIDLDIYTNESFVIYDARTRRILVKINVTTSQPLKEKEALPIAQYIPSLKKAAQLEFDREYVYRIERRPGGPVWTINGKSWPEYESYIFEAGKFNIIRLRDQSGRIHPVHFHGLFFKVLRRNGKFVDEGSFRDTVILYPNDVVDVALVPLDKGKWVNHCHIQEHAERGFMTAIEVV